MKKVFLVLVFPALLVAATYWLFWGNAAPAVAMAIDGVQMREVVSARNVIWRGWDLHGAFHVTDHGLILVESGDSIFDAVTGKSVLKQTYGDLRDFCTLGEGMVAIRGQHLCAFDNEELIPVLHLESSRMMLASAGIADGFYVYERGAGKGDIYSFRAGQKYQKLVHLDEPVFAVTGVKGRLFFSTWNKIITWSEDEQPSVILDLQAALPPTQDKPTKTAPVTSLAVDPESGVLYFSSGEGVFALVRDKVVLVVLGATGDLAFSRNVLFVKDSLQRCVLAFTGTSEAARRAVSREQNLSPSSAKAATGVVAAGER
jgi:hypothetical protein